MEWPAIDNGRINEWKALLFGQGREEKRRDSPVNGSGCGVADDFENDSALICPDYRVLFIPRTCYLHSTRCTKRRRPPVSLPACLSVHQNTREAQRCWQLLDGQTVCSENVPNRLLLIHTVRGENNWNFLPNWSAATLQLPCWLMDTFFSGSECIVRMRTRSRSSSSARWYWFSFRQ